MSLNVGLREKYKRQQDISDQKAAEEASILKQQQDVSTKTPSELMLKESYSEPRTRS